MKRNTLKLLIDTLNGDVIELTAEKRGVSVCVTETSLTEGPNLTWEPLTKKKPVHYWLKKVTLEELLEKHKKGDMSLLQYGLGKRSGGRKDLIHTS